MSDHDQTTEAGMGVSPPNLSGESGNTGPGGGGSLVQQGNSQQEDEASSLARRQLEALDRLSAAIIKQAHERRERQLERSGELIKDGYKLRLDTSKDDN